jgi:hypothetical protein
MLDASRFITILVLAVAAWLSNGPGLAATEVDLALVLAVDVSFSMEPDEQALQRQGFVEAFQSPEVHQAIRQGMLGRIAVIYVEWSGAFDQEIIVPWTVIERPAEGLAFAERLSQTPPHRRSYTSLSGAIDFSIRQLGQSGVQPFRQIIDISGDGANNQGRTVTLARDEALARGITINGLPIMLKRLDSLWDIDNLDLYFRDCVISGPGAFLVPVREKTQLVEAIGAKIIREVTDQSQPYSLVQPAQAAPPTDCLAGEKRVHQPTGR